MIEFHISLRCGAVKRGQQEKKQQRQPDEPRQVRITRRQDAGVEVSIHVMFIHGSFTLVQVHSAALSDLYIVKRLGVMAALAISAKLSIVYIILAVAIRT